MGIHDKMDGRKIGTDRKMHGKTDPDMRKDGSVNRKTSEDVSGEWNMKR